MQIDATNAQLLDLLQRDARMSVRELARRVHRAETTVRERIESMERQGVLRGYRAVVDPQRVGHTVHALVRAECDLRRLPEVARALETIPNVTAVYHTTGRRPLRIELWARDAAHLEEFLERRIAPLELSGVETVIVVRTLVEPRPLASGLRVPLVATAPVPGEAQRLPAVPAGSLVRP